MKAIATYEERRFSGKRSFELFEDRIRIAGKTYLANEFDLTLELPSLDPNFSVMRIREKGFVGGLWLIMVPAVVAGILITAFERDFTNPFVVLLLTMPLAGIVLCLATARKVEFSCFRNDAGLIALDVARAGKQTNEYDSFVETLANQIRERKSIDRSIADQDVAGRDQASVD